MSTGPDAVAFPTPAAETLKAMLWNDFRNG